MTCFFQQRASGKWTCLLWCLCQQWLTEGNFGQLGWWAGCWDRKTGLKTVIMHCLLLTTLLLTLTNQNWHRHTSHCCLLCSERFRGQWEKLKRWFTSELCCGLRNRGLFNVCSTCLLLRWLNCLRSMFERVCHPIPSHRFKFLLPVVQKSLVDVLYLKL